MENNDIEKDKKQYKELEKSIMLALNDRLYERKAITEEMYMSAKGLIIDRGLT